MIHFHWSLWNADKQKGFLLSHSIATFKFFFGSQAQYIVFTDNVHQLKKHLLITADVYGYDELDASVYNIDALSTWKKWIPKPRIDPAVVEIHVDIDMFLVNDPVEIKDFSVSGKKFLCMLENFRELWPYGSFGKMLPYDYKPINAGLFGQNLHGDISSNLNKAFEYWKQNIYGENEKYHDEQGALLWALSEFINQNEVFFLPNDRYRNVSPFDPPVEDIKKLTLIHATCDEHFGFYENLDAIKQVSRLPGTLK